MKVKQVKIPVNINEDNLTKIAIEQNVIENDYNWKLVRENDSLTKKSKDIIWIEWQDNGKFKEKHKSIGIGYSLMMSPFNNFFTWQTTPVTKIVEQREGYVKFNTENSTYELFKI